MSPVGCGTTIRSVSSRLLGNENHRFPPDHRGKTCRGLVGVRSRLGHSQAVLGCQPLEQVAHGAFLISVYGRVQHGLCARHNRATMTAAENAAAAVVAS